MENPVVGLDILEGNIRFPDNYDRFRQLASGHLRQRKNEGRNPDLEGEYAHRYVGKDGSTSVNVQLRDVDSKARPDVLKLEIGGQTSEVNVVARIWFTEKDKYGYGSAVCYKLSEDGTWYKQTASKYRYDKKENTDYWILGNVQAVDKNEERLFLESRLQSIQTSQTPARKVA